MNIGQQAWGWPRTQGIWFKFLDGLLDAATTSPLRYGDEAHLEEALDKIFRFNKSQGIPRKMAPVLTGAVYFNAQCSAHLCGCKRWFPQLIMRRGCFSLSCSTRAGC